MNKLLMAAAAGIAVVSACCKEPSFWKVENGQFINPETKQAKYYLGTNFWYGPILASEGEGGNFERLTSELDSLKALGLTNLRVLVGGDGPNDAPCRVTPTLQKAPGEYNDTLLVGLDRFMVELGKRNMSAVLYLNNSWEWSGGYGMYLEWAGEGEAVLPSVSGYGEYCKSVSKFVTCDKAKALFADYIRFIVGRKNTITGKPYSEDPAIFSWQIGNEPRCFRADEKGREAFKAWLWDCAELLKSLDPNHMVSVGSEGKWGCEESLPLYKAIHECPNIDYLTAHIWPYNWSWVREDSLKEKLPVAIKNMNDYVDEHEQIARELCKPLVVEEFGFPRDGFEFKKGTPTESRDLFYRAIFSRLKASKAENGLFAGLNFWGWSGSACQSDDHFSWQKGDDYCGDPAQEQQGLNGVYIDDYSTISLIRSAQGSLHNLTPRQALLSRLELAQDSHKAMFGHQDDLMYGHAWLPSEDETEFSRSDVKDVCGSYPAVTGFELGGIEMGESKSLDSVDFGQMRQAIIANFRRGGITTLSWHPRNPLTGGTAWDFSSDRVVESILPGGENSELFMTWLSRVADFIDGLKDGEEDIPVIWRPWHEHTGTWFWWGHDVCTSEQYKALWKLTYDYVALERGLKDRLVWAYSPNASFDEAEYWERYPGDDLVDILGFDFYCFGKEYPAVMDRSLALVTDLARRKGKTAAITETGYATIPDPTWWTGVVAPMLEKYQVSYILVWRNAYQRDDHFYAPFPGAACEEDFKEFAKNPAVGML